MASLEEHIAQLGLHLNDSAKTALSSLPLESAAELLHNLRPKVSAGRVKNPSNYVCATIARGYVPEADGGAQTFCQAPQPAKTVVVDINVAASRLQSTVGMMKAEQAGVDLNNDAIQALLQLPSQHASQLLEQVAEKKDSIRDLSNYVCATVARGFHPKDAVGMASPLLLRQDAGLAAPQSPGAHAKGKGKNTKEGKVPALVPPDVTLVERAVLDLNERDLWQGQNLDANSLLALRCLSEDQAMDLVGALYSKGSGKGGVGVSISNPNNYLQAAVAKIIRDGGTSGGMNFTGNQTRQKAAELGLSLEDQTLQVLARLPLRSSVQLLQSAVAAQAEGADPNSVIVAEASLTQDFSRKRPRED